MFRPDVVVDIVNIYIWYVNNIYSEIDKIVPFKMLHARSCVKYEGTILYNMKIRFTALAVLMETC